MRKHFKLLLTLCMISLVNLHAQNTVKYQYPEQEFERGKMAFYDGRFNQANEYLNTYLQQEDIPAYKSEAEFLILVSVLFLEKTDADEYLESYARDGKNAYFSNQAYFYLGDYYRSQEDWSQAQKNFSRCKAQKLPKSLQDEYYLKNGLVLLEKNKLKDAYASFQKVGKTSAHAEDATYNLGYIHYLNEELDEAQKYFDQVKDRKYQESISHFKLQKQFAEGDMEEARKSAVSMYKSSKNEYKAEIARILGYIYFQDNELDKAVNYYEVYQKNIEKLSREDIYLLGESYFGMQEYEKAADAFTKVATLQDELSQNAYNKLASCFIKLDDKQMARMAFESASRFEFDKEVQEEALFNYCKLTYELSYSPFNEILGAFEKFIKLFPDSKFNPQVYSLLTDVFLNTNNYEQAYESIKKLDINNPKLDLAMQRIAYYRAIELFNDLKLEPSIDYFNKSLEKSENDKKLKAKAHYWRGEAYFRLEKYDEAIENFNAFVQSPYASRLEEFKIAHYSLGYAYFKLNQPNPAIIWFGKYATLQKSQPDIRLSDTYNRLGDCYYLKRNFASAIQYYDYAIEMGLNGSDYSYLQKASCQGLQKNNDGKIETLSELTRLFRESNLLDDAYFELGETYTFVGKSNNALASYKTLIDQFQDSEYAPKAMANMALIHYNTDNESQAEAMYKRVINEYPRTEEAQVAINALKTIAIDNNSVDEYLLYTKKLGNRVNVGDNDADSLTYISAEKLFMKGNVENSKKYFGDYIQKFPNGRYLLNAHYYKADCHFRSKETALAISELEAVVNMPTNRYTEESLAKLASFYYEGKQYDTALEYYKRLNENAKSSTNQVQAGMGALRCYYILDQCDKVQQQAQTISEKLQLSDEYKEELTYYKAKCLLKDSKNSEAMAAFQQISGNTNREFGAEAKYQVSRLYYEANQTDKAIAEVKDFIQKNTPYQYWLAKSFIVLAQISVDKKDDFQAKQYLMSVKENYKGNDEVQEEVARMIFEIDEREAQRYQHRRDSLLKLLNDTQTAQ